LSEDRTRDSQALGAAVLRALDHLPIPVTIHRVGSAGPDRVYANQALADLIGVSLASLRASPAFQHLSPDERQRTETLQRAWLEGATAPAQVESVLIRADGRAVPIEVRGGATTLDGDRVLVLFLLDLTERRRVEEALRASEALFRQAADSAPDALAIVVDGRFAYANPVCTRILGYEDPAELPGVRLADFVDASDAQVLRERIARVLAGETAPSREYRCRRKDGTTVLLEISSLPISFRGQRAALAIGREVGERRRRQAEMVRAERMAAVGALAAGVAHEINNPLTYTMLQLDRLRSALPRAVPDPAQRTQLLAMIADAADGSSRVAGIVRDLLWFSRGEADSRGPADVLEVAETAIKLATSTTRHRAQIVRRFASPPPAAIAGPRLAQVLVNLLVNAAQAFDRDDLGANRIDIVATGDSGRVVLEVADNGPGFPDDVLPHVFEPFFTTKAGGTGLGLAISRSIIDEVGGAISVHHRSGGGALIRVELPAWRGEAAAPTPPPETAPSARSRVAIIDDEAPIARSLGEWLEIDHDVTIYVGAEEALVELEAAVVFDCVICDLRMPVLSGVELLRRLIVRRPEYRGRFIFIGGAVTPEQASAARELAADVLHKPFDMTAVDRAVSRRLRR
jgi:PAS domain S-box-containing protein